MVLQLVGKADAIGAHLTVSDQKSYIETVSHKFASVINYTSDTNDAKVVFFDILHRFTIVYDETTALFLHVVVLFSTVCVWTLKFARWTLRDWIGCARMCVIIPCCIFAAFASTTFGSVIYSKLLGLKMVWYGSIEMVLAIFVPHLLFGVSSMLLFLLPRKLAVNRVDHMLFAKTIYYSVMAVLFMRKRVMSSYLPLLLLMVLNICAVQGPAIPVFLRHLEIMTAVSVLTASQIKSTMTVTVPIVGFLRADWLPHDTVASLIVTYCCLNYFVIPSLPILCEYAAALKRLIRILLATSVFVAFFFLLKEDRFLSNGSKSSLMSFSKPSKKYNPYSIHAPKRLTALHFHSPNMTPSSVLVLTYHDAIEADEKRILSPLFLSDESIGSIAAEPEFGSMGGAPLEAFYPYANKIQSKTFLRTLRKPDLGLPTLRKVDQEKFEQSWKVTYAMKGIDSHLMSIRFATRGNTVVKGWSFNFSVDATDGMAWIRYDGSESYSFWLLLEHGDSTKTDEKGAPMVTFVVSSARCGSSRSVDDLKKLDFEFWESPTVLTTTAVEYQL